MSDQWTVKMLNRIVGILERIVERQEEYLERKNGTAARTDDRSARSNRARTEDYTRADLEVRVCNDRER